MTERSDSRRAMISQLRAELESRDRKLERLEELVTLAREETRLTRSLLDLVPGEQRLTKKFFTQLELANADLERKRDDLRRRRHNLARRRRAIEEKRNSRLDLSRSIWSGLQSAELERLLYTVFSRASRDVIRHYDSAEIGITGALAAYLCSHSDDLSEEIRDSLRDLSPTGNPVEFELSHVDLQKTEDVGGADFAILLDIDIAKRHTRSAFCVFQAKRQVSRPLSLSGKARRQLDRLLYFTHAAYYLFYPTAAPRECPQVVPARVVRAYVDSRRSQTITRDELDAVAVDFQDYVSYDFVSGWSGDDRSPRSVSEFVVHVVRPVHLVRIRVGIPEKPQDRIASK